MGIFVSAVTIVTKKLELYPDSVFRYGIGWYFLGIFLTDTKGKLGKDLQYRTFGGNPLFVRFCPLFDGPSPTYEGVPAKFHKMELRPNLTVQEIPYIPYQIPTNRQVSVTYTDTNQTASKQMGYNSTKNRDGK